MTRLPAREAPRHLVRRWEPRGHRAAAAALSTGFAFLLVLSPVSGLGQSGSILSVQFEGNSSLDAVRLQGCLRFLRPGSTYQADLAQVDVENVRRCYLEEGFLKAALGAPRPEVRREGGRAPGVDVRIGVVEGPQYLLGDLSIEGNSVFSTAVLMQLAPLRSGQPYSRRKLEEWREKVADGYRTMGYIRFSGTLDEQVRDVLRRVDTVLRCSEGAAFRVGRITVTGDPRIDAADFKRRLLVSEGGLFNPEMLLLSRQFLNQSGLYQPIRDSDVEVRVNDPSSTVDLTIRVTLLKAPDR